MQSPLDTETVPAGGSQAPTVESRCPETWDWETLDLELRPRLVSLGIRRFRFTPEEAEDLVQDVYARLWERRPRVRNLKGYVATAFLHRCFDWLESNSRKGRFEARLEAPWPADPNAGDRLLVAVHVRGALRRMTPICRFLIHRYCVERARLADLANERSCSIPAVWKRLDRCIKRMRTCLIA